jgi:hypothetical protein
MNQKVSIGRIVHFVTENGEHKAAMVVAVWGSECCNLQVFTDCNNERGHYIVNDLARKGLIPEVVWVTSVQYSEKPNPRTWHWPEREEIENTVDNDK